MSTSIPLFKPYLSSSIPERISKVCASGMVGEGDAVEEFGQGLSLLWELNPYILPVNSCTSALHLALICAGVGPGDEVISTPLTMAATNLAILYCGAKVVWADIDPCTLFLDYEDALRKITPKTKAIMATAVGGVVSRDLLRFADSPVPVILDCAHALTSSFDGGHILQRADFCCFSFQAIKTLTTGDGGALTTYRLGGYELAERLKWFGMTRKRPPGISGLAHQNSLDIKEVGYKYQMNNISAAIGLANLESVRERVRATKGNAKTLLQELSSVSGIELFSPPDEADPDWWVFGVLASNREALAKYLEERGIATSSLWRRNDKHSVFSGMVSKDPLVGMNSVENRLLFIPNGWWLEEGDLSRIIEGIKSFYGGKND